MVSWLTMDIDIQTANAPSTASQVFYTTELLVNILSFLGGSELRHVAAAHSSAARIVASRVYRVAKGSLKTNASRCDVSEALSMSCSLLYFATLLMSDLGMEYLEMRFRQDPRAHLSS